MAIQRLNTNTYALSVTSSSASITLTDADASDNGSSNWIIYNAGTVPVFVVSGRAAAPTAAIPASATVPVAGKMVAGGSIVTFSRSKDHKYLSAITSTTSTIYVSVGDGE